MGLTDQEAWKLVLENGDLVRWSIEQFRENDDRFSFEELLTAAQLAAFQSARTWDPSLGALSPYLHRAISLGLRDEVRSLRVGEATGNHGDHTFASPTNTGELPEEEEAGDFVDALVGRLDAEASRDDLRLALEALPERNRDVIVSRVLRGASFPQIGTELGISKQRASQLYKRGIEQLKEQLSGS